MSRHARHRHDQAVFHELLARHDKITRDLSYLPDGISARTVSSDPEIVSLLHDHVVQMHRRMGEGFGLRKWDPAFVEIFAQADKVQMDLKLIPEGVEVIETSADPNVVKLIQAHGRGINGFVEQGGTAASQATPLPEDYTPAMTGR
ncbi:MAG: hypothetical protein ACWA47_13305 [Brevirhabdus sp.]